MANEITSLFGSLPESQTNDGKIILHTDNGAERSSVALSELVGGGSCIEDGGTLIDDSIIDVPNNASSTLTSEQETLTLNVNVDEGEVPNFAVEILAETNIELTVTKTVGNGTPVTLYASSTGGSSLVSGKYYQVSCIGNCWTLAEFITASPTPPSPSFEYVILQNFVTGHDIGTPDLNNGCPWISTIQTDSWYENNWMGPETYGGNLLSSNVGDAAIDTSTPLDFSKYGINDGTPFAVTTCNADNTNTRVAFSIQNLEAFPITIETFACGRPHYEEDDYVDIAGVVPVFTIGKPFDNGLNKPNLSFCVYPNGGYAGEDNVIFVKADIGLAYDESTEGQELIGIKYWEPGESNSMHKWLAHWHHYALTIDNDNMYMFVDGSLKGTISLSTQLNFEYSSAQYNKTLREFLNEMDMSFVYVKNAGNSEGYSFDARFAQFAVCQECKWTTDFTVPTEAY